MCNIHSVLLEGQSSEEDFGKSIPTPSPPPFSPKSFGGTYRGTSCSKQYILVDLFFSVEIENRDYFDMQLL